MALSESANHLNGKLKVLIFGAGAIGTYIGGSLALAGQQVIFVEQPKTVEELRQLVSQVQGTVGRVEQRQVVASEAADVTRVAVEDGAEVAAGSPLL